MPSSASPSDGDQSLATPEVSDSFLDDDGAQADDDDEEEVEEDGDDGEEEEEAVEEEEEEGENELDLRDKADDREDAREDVKSHRGDGSFRSGSSTRGEFGLDVAFAENNRSEQFVVDKKYVGILSEKSSSTHCINPDSDSNAGLSSSLIFNAKTSNSPNTDVKEVVAATSMNTYSGRKDVPQSQGEIKQMDMQSGDDTKRMAARFVSSGKETRSPPSGAEIKDQNKRLAIVCDFYAKGWCIKGSSCRFLHVNDHQKNDLPQREGDVAANDKGEVQLEGLNETTQGARLPNDPPAASVGNKSAFSNSSHLSSQMIQPWKHIESKTLHHLPEIPSFPFSFKDVGSESMRKNGSANDYGDHSSLTNRDGSVFRNRLCPEYAVSSSHSFPSSHSRSMGELASMQSKRPYNYRPLPPLLGDPPNSCSSNSLLATGTILSNRVSAWTGPSLPFSCSSLSAGHSGCRSSPLLQSSSHFSGSGSDNLTSAKHKVSSNDWEPSVPFQPSFLLRSLIACPGSQYDPLRDIVELPKGGDISFKASLHSQGSSVANTSHQKNNGDVVSETRGVTGNDDTMSVSSHNANNGKDMQSTEAEVARTSTDGKHMTMPKQENSLGSSVVKDITGARSHGRHRRLGPRDSVDVKVDSLRKKHKMDAGHIVEGSVLIESKALRQFRAALIDSVKESLKPKWREGLLSKDAHNKIVKKAVEKVLSTLQAEQIPTSMELVEQYLASSRPKIDKLVEGYAEIYGKL